MRSNDQPESLRLPSSIIDDDEIERNLRESAWQQIIRGDDNVDDFVEWMTDGDDPVTVEQAAAAFAYVPRPRHTTGHMERRANEPDESVDHARPDRHPGPQNFSCCGTCADREIWDELDDTCP